MKKITRFLFYIILVLGCVLLLHKYGPSLVVSLENKEFDIADVTSQRLDSVLESVENHSENYDIDDVFILSEDYPIWEEGLERTVIASQDSMPDVIKISVSGCKLSVAECEESEISLEGSGNLRMQGYVQEDTLYVIMISKGTLTADSSAPQATLYLPTDRNFFGADLVVGAGSVEVESLHAASMTADVDAGNLIIRKAKTSEAELAVGAGNIEFTGNVTDALKCDVTAGNLDVCLEGKEEDFNYGINKVAGVIEIDGNTYKDKETKTVIENGALKAIDLYCTMGKIDISFTH